jgi:hypothetical protein
MNQSPFRRRLKIGDMALPEGAEVGLVGGVAVVAVFFVRDFAAGHWLHTPSVLGTLLFRGPEAARTVVSAPGIAAAYNLVHFALWMAFGVAAVEVAKRVEKDSRVRFVPWIFLAVLMASYGLLDLWVRESGLGRTHLWSGGLVAAAVVTLMLIWRHPAVVSDTDDDDAP